MIRELLPEANPLVDVDELEIKPRMYVYVMTKGCRFIGKMNMKSMG